MNPQTLELIKKALQAYDSQITQLNMELSKARAVGVDVAPLQARVDKLTQQANNLKNQYGSQLQ